MPITLAHHRWRQEDQAFYTMHRMPAQAARDLVSHGAGALQDPKSCMRNGSDDDLYRTVKGVGIKKVRAVLSSDF